MCECIAACYEEKLPRKIVVNKYASISTGVASKCIAQGSFDMEN